MKNDINIRCILSFVSFLYSSFAKCKIDTVDVFRFTGHLNNFSRLLERRECLISGFLLTTIFVVNVSIIPSRILTGCCFSWPSDLLVGVSQQIRKMLHFMLYIAVDIMYCSPQFETRIYTSTKSHVSISVWLFFF